MKYLELFESKENREILGKCKATFIDAWGDTLDLSHINIEEPYIYSNGVKYFNGKFMLSSNYGNTIDKNNVSDFIALFDFLHKIDNITFRFRDNRFQIHMNNIDSLKNFINQLEMVAQSKKYNL